MTKIYRVKHKSPIFQGNYHTIVFAMTGSGKTALIERIMASRFEQGTKVIIWDLFKQEACQLGFPETNSKLVSLIRNNFFQQPQAYPHEVYVPFAVDKFVDAEAEMSIELPRHTQEFREKQQALRDQGLNTGWTYWKPFKIDFADLKASDLIVLLRKPTESGINLLELLFRTKRFKSSAEMINELIGLMDKTNGNTLNVGLDTSNFEAEMGNQAVFGGILRLLSNVQKSGFLCSGDNQYKLDLDKIMRDNKTITTFSMYNVDEAFAFLIFVAVSRQIVSLRKNTKYPRLCIVIPELASFAPASSSESPFASGEFSSLGIIKKFSKESRILGVDLLTDTQFPNQVESGVLKNFRLVAVGRSHREAIEYINKNVMHIHDSVREKAEALEVGRFALFKVGDRDFEYPYYACPCLARHRREGEDVGGWVSEQTGIETINYKDDLKDSLKVSLKKRVVKADKSEVDPNDIDIKAYLLREENKSHEEIAEMLAVPVGSVGYRIRQGKAKHNRILKQ